MLRVREGRQLLRWIQRVWSHPLDEQFVEDRFKIESVPQRVARAALQLDEMGVSGSSFHAQTGYFRQHERAMRSVQIPPRAHIPGVASPQQTSRCAGHRYRCVST